MRRQETIRLERAGLGLLAAALLCVTALAEEPKESPFVTAAKSLTLSGYAQVLAVEWDHGVDTFPSGGRASPSRGISSRT
ncbi:MAG: hypothetical protein ACXVJK_08360 [Candidatus Aminicenantales bacterium]